MEISWDKREGSLRLWRVADWKKIKHTHTHTHSQTDRERDINGNFGRQKPRTQIMGSSTQRYCRFYCARVHVSWWPLCGRVQFISDGLFQHCMTNKMEFISAGCTASWKFRWTPSYLTLVSLFACAASCKVYWSYGNCRLCRMHGNSHILIKWKSCTE